jgi:hypothetical protein
VGFAQRLVDDAADGVGEGLLSGVALCLAAQARASPRDWRALPSARIATCKLLGLRAGFSGLRSGARQTTTSLMIGAQYAAVPVVELGRGGRQAADPVDDDTAGDLRPVGDAVLDVGSLCSIVLGIVGLVIVFNAVDGLSEDLDCIADADSSEAIDAC